MFALRHLVPAALKAFFRMIFLGVLFALIGGGAVLAVAYARIPHWPPDTMTIVVAVVIAVLTGYAVGLTTLVREVIRGVKDVERGVVHSVEGEVQRERAHIS